MSRDQGIVEEVASPFIRPFRCAIPEAHIDDLRGRLSRTRWPEHETVDDWSQGAPLEYVREICRYWAASQLNSYQQGVTTIDGLDIHFLHAPSPTPGAQPLIIVHGWPGSVFEHLDIIEPLRNPEAYGGQPEDAYHVVVPSLPGFGFSQKPSQRGWTVERTGAALSELMQRLGYPRFFVQGGDWGSIVAASMGTRQLDSVRGIHFNMAICDPAELLKLGDPTPEESRQLDKLQYYNDWEGGYSQQQSTRPQTTGYGLVDSPAGQCAWILEKFAAWTDCDGHPENVLTRDKMLGGISLYWLTATAASSARLYWESFKPVLSSFEPVPAPAAYSCFPGDVFTMSERWARTRYPDLRYYSQPARGGHFPSMEQPAVFVNEVRAGLRALN